MRLSLGQVVGDKLQCRYHGWTFTPDGQGESPGTPKLHACADAYDAREEHGAVWVKPRDVDRAFPTFDVAGYLPICVLKHTAEAPLELVTDNFCEIEHTPTTHAIFGYDLKRMHEVSVRFEPTDTTVRIINTGPSKRLGPLLRTLIGIRDGFLFYDDWTTHFSPVYSVYDHWWADPEDAQQSKVRWRLYIFFTPVDETADRPDDVRVRQVAVAGPGRGPAAVPLADAQTPGPGDQAGPGHPERPGESRDGGGGNEAEPVRPGPGAEPRPDRAGVSGHIVNGTMRILIAGLMHESNTFAATPADRRRFEEGSLAAGPDVLPIWKDAHHEFGGFIEGAGRFGYDPVPSVMAWATPSGPVADAVLDEVVDRTVTDYRKAPTDGVLSRCTGPW